VRNPRRIWFALVVRVGLVTAACAKHAPQTTLKPEGPVGRKIDSLFHLTFWIPAGVKKLRGVIVHQHGCGEGSCKSGLTGAYDLHWQALAKKHACALLSPTY